MNAHRTCGFVLSMMVALAAQAHERPILVVKTVIDSATIRGRLEFDKKKQAEKVKAAELQISGAIATRMEDVFAFLRWSPDAKGQPVVGELTVTIKELSGPSSDSPSTYVLDYQRRLFLDIADKVRTLDYGADDPLYKPSDDKQLGNAAKLGAKVAEKVAMQFCRKRKFAMSSFFSEIPLCPGVPESSNDHSFTLHLPFNEIKATEETSFRVEFFAKSSKKAGVLNLSPLQICNSCPVPRALFQSLVFDGFGNSHGSSEWTDEIYSLFDAGKKQIVSSKTYVTSYRSTSDTSTLNEMN